MDKEILQEWGRIFIQLGGTEEMLARAKEEPELMNKVIAIMNTKSCSIADENTDILMPGFITRTAHSVKEKATIIGVDEVKEEDLTSRDYGSER